MPEVDAVKERCDCGLDKCSDDDGITPGPSDFLPVIEGLPYIADTRAALDRRVGSGVIMSLLLLAYASGNLGGGGRSSILGSGNCDSPSDRRGMRE